MTFGGSPSLPGSTALDSLDLSEEIEELSARYASASDPFTDIMTAALGALLVQQELRHVRKPHDSANRIL